MVKSVMSGKLKLKGHLKHLARWPLYLSVLLIALNILVYVINIKAGVVVTMGNVLYLVAAITLLFYHRPLMFNDLIAFASQYEFLEKKVLEELALPYAVMDMQGRMIWSNRMFSQLTGKDPFYRKNVSTIFPDITANKLPGHDGKDITVWGPHLSYLYAESFSGRVCCTVQTADGYSGSNESYCNVSVR